MEKWTQMWVFFWSESGWQFMILIGIFFFVLQEERQADLRNRARRLIAETRARSMNLESPTSPDKSITHRITLSPERTISPINNVDGFNVISNKSGNSKENSPIKQKSNHSSPPRFTPPRDVENNHSTSPIQSIVLGERNGNSPSLQSFNSVVANLSPQHEKKVNYWTSSYIGSCLSCELFD